MEFFYERRSVKQPFYIIEHSIDRDLFSSHSLIGGYIMHRLFVFILSPFLYRISLQRNFIFY
jgi:hypothetical protein